MFGKVIVCPALVTIPPCFSQCTVSITKQVSTFSATRNLRVWYHTILAQFGICVCFGVYIDLWLYSCSRGRMVHVRYLDCNLLQESSLPVSKTLPWSQAMWPEETWTFRVPTLWIDNFSYFHRTSIYSHLCSWCERDKEMKYTSFNDLWSAPSWTLEAR